LNANNDVITSAIKELKELKELGLGLDEVMVLMKGYEKFSESSDEERRELMNGIKQLIGSQ
jgi:hypothetical protein